MNRKVILFLYTEFSSYLEACFNCLLAKNKVEIHLVRYPVNTEAPFLFGNLNIKNYFKNEFNNYQEIISFTNKLKPDLILVSGWIDKDYLKVALRFKNSSVTVMAMDTQWTGSLKQKLMTFTAKNYFLKRFKYVWVPGIRQKKYAQNIGFSDSHIFEGFYSCNVDLFKKYYDDTKHIKRKKFPKVFLFLGRYIKNKGIYELWDAFKKLSNNHNHQWELWCVGDGQEWGSRLKHPKIKHLGFLQPNELNDVISKSGVYILPSKFEPWGVSLHEFVSAGFPVIASRQVGSSDLFLKNNKNGLLIGTSSSSEIYNAMRKMIEMSREELLAMSEESLNLSKKITPALWADKLINFIND